jgi:hypothetical protein
MRLLLFLEVCLKEHTSFFSGFMWCNLMARYNSELDNPALLKDGKQWVKAVLRRKIVISFRKIKVAFYTQNSRNSTEQ